MLYNPVFVTKGCAEAHAMSDIITDELITDKLLIWLKYPILYQNHTKLLILDKLY